MAKKNTGGTKDDAVIQAETAFLLSQLDDIRLQEQFLEEERQKLVEQQEFDFEGLLSRLQAQLAQQQQGFEQQLATSENIVGELGQRTEQLQGVLQQQAQNRERVAQAAQETLQRGQGFLTNIGQRVAGQSGQAAQQIGQRAQATTQQALAVDPLAATRRAFLAAEGEAAQQRIGQERERVIGQTQRTEAQTRQRRQEALANLRGQRATPQQQTTAFGQVRPRDPQTENQRFLSRLPEQQRIGGPQRLFADEEEFLAEQRRLRQQDFVGAISGQRRTGNTAGRL